MTSADLYNAIAIYVQLAVLALPNAGGQTANEARAIGEKVARLVLADLQERGMPIDLTR